MDIILVKAFQNAFFHSEYKMNHLPHISTNYFHQYTNIYQSIQTQEQIQSLSWTGFLSHTFQHRAVSDCYPSTTETKKLKIWLWHTHTISPSPPVFSYCHLSVSQTLHITWPILSSHFFLCFLFVFPSSLWLVSHLPHAPSELGLMPAAPLCHLTSDYHSTAPYCCLTYWLYNQNAF